MLTNEEFEKVAKEYTSVLENMEPELLYKANGKVKTENGQEFEVNGVLFTIGKFPYSPYPHLVAHFSNNGREVGVVIFSKAEHYGESFMEFNLEQIKSNEPTVFDIEDFEKFKKNLKVESEIVKEPYLNQLKQMEEELENFKNFLKEKGIE